MISGSSALEQRENIITPKLEPNLVGANPPPTKVSAGVTESVDEPENSSAAKTRETDEDDGWEDLSIDDLASLFLNFKTLDKVIYYGVLTTNLINSRLVNFNLLTYSFLSKS